MERSAVYHVSEHNYAYAIDNDVLVVRLRAKKNDIDEVVVHYKNLYDHSPRSKKMPMQKVLSDKYCDLFQAILCIKERRFKYCFEIFSGSEKVFYTSDGFLGKPSDENFFYYPCINEDDIFALPGWAEGEIIYQVFVDRFFKGDPSKSTQDIRPWNTPPEKTMVDRGGFKGQVREDTYYGGDFRGITSKLDYISNLGAKILYLSPVFVADSYHKYDTVDYYKIESAFGNMEDLIELVEEAHRRDMKVVLDGVFNHCSYANEMFQDVVRNQERSRYRDWFHIRSFPLSENRKDYDSFGNVAPSMPRLNTSNQEVIDYIIDVTTYWTKTLNLDGWRLDVADEVSHDLWVQLRKALKSLSPGLLIIGEVWNNASRWLQGNEMDTVTNYKFRKALLEFIQGERDSGCFWDRVCSSKMLYKSPVYNYLINLVGSHDTTRCRTFLDSEELHKLAMVVTLAFEGMPLIYYGDELAMEGGFDPDNRRPMKWEDTQTSFAKSIREFSQFRASSEVLKKGSTHPLHPGSKEIIAFTREYAGEKVHLIANFGDQSSSVELPGKVCDLVLGNIESIDLYRVSVGPRDFALIRS